MSVDNGLLNTEQTVQRLRISRATLHRRVRDGEIMPVIKNPALRRQPLYFRPSDVDKLARVGVRPGVDTAP